MGNTGFVQNITTILTQARNEIRANMQAKGINASGRTSAALQVVQRGDKMMLIKAEGQNAPFGTLQYGRKGGAVPMGFTQILKQWSIDKGLQFANERERNSFAYLLGRKIAREGTERHRNPRHDIYDEPLQRAIDRVEQEAQKYILGKVKASVSSSFV